MEQTNYQELNKKILTDLITDPSVLSADHSEALEKSVQQFPYSQLLRSFYVRSLRDNNSEKFDDELSKTALFTPERTILRKIIEDNEDLISPFGDNRSEPAEKAEEFVKESETVSEDTVIEEELVEETPEVTQEQVIEEEISQPQPEPADPGDELEELEEPVSVENEETDKGESEIELSEVKSQAEEKSDEQFYIEGDIENLDEKQVEEASDLVDHIFNEQPFTEEEKSLPEAEDELDILMRQNAVPADFLKEQDSLETPVYDSEPLFRPEVETLDSQSAENSSQKDEKVSRYNDDKLPYSFLWWLNKTRKEHSETYQPYVSFQLDTSQSIRKNTVDQLSSQIIENIFHLQSPIDELENAPRTVPFQVKRKDDHILEKFIKDEPQIKPPNSDKLDTENKARKSAEDPNDLVSETLAQIYTDQMLFHKAIDTYQKLSLKFPEKSTYFADRIRELEKKIN